MWISWPYDLNMAVKRMSILKVLYSCLTERMEHKDQCFLDDVIASASSMKAVHASIIQVTELPIVIDILERRASLNLPRMDLIMRELQP